MKKKLYYFENFIRFTFSHDLRNKSVFSNYWSDKQAWEDMGALYNYYWEASASDAWLDYYPSVYMPIDYIEEAEKRKAKDLQKFNGDNKWGLEIGVRYFPEREYFPPVFLHEIFFIEREVMHERIIRQKDKFRFLHIFEIILAGHPSDSLLKQKNLHKYWLYNNLEEITFTELYESRGISWAEVEAFGSDAQFNKLLGYGAQVDSKLLNIKHKTRRYMRWQVLKMRREGFMSTKLSAIGIFLLFIKAFLDIVSGRFFKQYDK